MTTISDKDEFANVSEDDELIGHDQAMNKGMWWRHLLAGGVAGAVSRTSTAPLDRLKVFLQVKGTEFRGLHNTFKEMLHEGGYLSLWRGNGVNVLKMAPESAIKFMTYDQIKRVIKGNTDHELQLHERFLAGSIAGGVAQSAIYPIEVLKTRLALRHTGQYKSIADAVIQILRNEGIASFYRGFVPNSIGILPYAGIDLAVYETLKNLYIESHSKDEKCGVLVMLSCGTVSTTCGQLVTYPLALVRTRLQANPDKRNTMTGLFRQIIDKEGFFGLYRGMALNFVKVVPAVAISYVIYEKVRQALGAPMR